MREKGQVTEITGSLAMVCLEPSDACKKCPSSDFCRPQGNVRIIEVKNTVDAKIGDCVYIETPPRAGLLAIFLLFCLPVVLGLIGILLGVKYGEIFSVIFGVAGFTIGLIFAKLINNILGHKHKLLPHIIEITERERA